MEYITPSKYKRWYLSITNRGQSRQIDSYTESHHIIPACLGGTESANNKTDLTAREHFICHWLLTKIYEGNDRHKMLNALRMMRAENPNQKRYSTKITARVYAKLKEEYARLQSERFSGSGNGFYGKHHTVEAKNRISKANKGRVQPTCEKEKQIAAITGRKRAPFSEEWIAKLSTAKKGPGNNRYGVEVTEETRKKIGDKIRGRKQTDEEKELRRQAILKLGLKREKKRCPHCQQEVAVNGYARWHGDNCKSKLS